MVTITLTIEMTRQELDTILPTLMRSVDEDMLIGLRVKDLDTAEHTLAPQVLATVLAIGNEDGDL